MIRFSNVSKAYHGATQPALQGLNFHLPVGSMTYLVGHSGAGKSTLLKLIMGMEKANAGNIWFNGHDITRLSKYEIPFLRRQIGMVHQDYRLLTDRSVAENVALPLMFRGIPKKERMAKADKMLDLVGLSKHKDHRPNEMSGGQQQRVGVARALVLDPEIIFADEPTGNLDSNTSAEVMRLMQKVVRERNQTLVMVTHDNHLASFADRIFHIIDGKIVKIEDNRQHTELSI